MEQNGEQKGFYKERIEKLKERLTESFVFKNFENEILNKLEKDIPTEYREPFATFDRNIKSLVSVAKLPIEMAFERAIKFIYDDIKRKHQILSLKDIINDDDKDIYAEDSEQHSREEKIIAIAAKEFNDLIKTTDGQDKFWFNSLAFVFSCAYESKTTSNFLNASKELINQSTLLTWSALEIFMRDFFILFLNKNPEKVEALSKVPMLKQRFDLRNIGTDQFLKYNFNLSGNMGDVLIENFDFSNIDLIKSIYDTLFGNAELNKALKSISIWNLYQNRNLIVHKGGIVDQKYIGNTNTQLCAGEKLFIQPEEFQTYFASIVSVATALASVIDVLE